MSVVRKFMLGEIGPVRMCKRIMKDETSLDGEIPFFKIGTFGGKADVFISRERYEEYKSKYPYPKRGDVLISAAGTIGRLVVFDGGESYFQDCNIVWVENDEMKVTNECLYYALQLARWKPSQGSTILRLYNDDIRAVEFFAPESLSDQRHVASILSTIDHKIALNRKRIATLEAMAKEIYDYWFVQFDFPDAHGRPYKSSGGAMVYNPDLKREIPKGWEVKPLGEIAEVVNGATPATANPRNYDGDVVWITPKDLSDQRSKFTYGGNRTISREGYDSCSTHMLPRGSILMSSRAPIGLLSIAAVDLCTNQGFKSFVPKEIDDNLYLYYYLKEHMSQIEAMGSGTTFKEVSRESMISFPIPYVLDRKVYASFVAIAKPIFNQQELLGTELARLSAFRDFLLPVLMNGQVRVG